MVFGLPAREPAQEAAEVAEEVFAEVGSPGPMAPFFREAEVAEELGGASSQGRDHLRFFLLPEPAEAAQLALGFGHGLRVKDPPIGSAEAELGDPGAIAQEPGQGLLQGIEADLALGPGIDEGSRARQSPNLI